MKQLICVVAGILFFLQAGQAVQNVFYVAKSQAREVLTDVQRQFPGHQFVPLNGAWTLREDGISIRVPVTAELRTAITLDRQVSISDADTSEYVLHVTPQNCGVEVLWNDSLISRFYHPFLTERIPVSSDLIRSGDNTLSIRLIPHRKLAFPMPEWFPENVPKIFGGLISVFLERIPKGKITQFNYRSRLVDSVLVTQWKFRSVGVSDSALTVRLVYARKGVRLAEKTIAVSGPAVTVRDTLKLQQFWSPSSPHALQFEMAVYRGRILADKITGTLANREVAVQGSTFLLNHQRPVLRGSNYVLQLADGVEVFNLPQVYQDLQWLKKAKFNSLYVFDHPLPEPFYRLCDELGLMVFQGLPIFLNGRKGFKKYPSDSEWQAYIRRVARLAERHPSIVSIGIAEQYVDASPASRLLMQRVAGNLPSPTVPYFVHTLIPLVQLPAGIHFQMTEVVNRHRPYEAVQHIVQAAREQLIFPVVSGKAYTYRVDSTTVVHDLVQVRLLTRFMEDPLQSGQIQGSFIHTYSDYYLNMPSVQNGFHRNLQLNKIGLVDLNRQPRQILLNPDESVQSESDESLIISEAFSSQSYLYVILGLLNAFLFLFIYQRFVEFRRNVLYSIKKPHGFFVNIQERRVIPFSETFLLMFVLALNAGIVWSSIFYFFRNNLVFDYLLSLFFFTPGVKGFVAGTIWQQWRFVALATLVVMLVFYLMAVPIKAFSFRQQHRILFRQAWSGAVWSAAPMLLLFPFVPLMYNLLLTMKSFWIPLGVLLYFHVWIYFRWINALRVLTDRLYGRTFLLVTAVGVLMIVGIGAFLQWEYGLWDHLARIYQLFVYAHK